MAKKKKCSSTTNETCSMVSSRELAQKELERLDAMDVESAKKALNDFFTSQEWTRYGCKVLVQGKFVGDSIKTELLVVKDK